MNGKRLETAGALAILLGGCVTYTQGELAALSAVDICELESMQRPNLSPDSRKAIQSELQRRNENCRSHTAEVAQRAEDFLWRETYGNQSP